MEFNAAHQHGGNPEANFKRFGITEKSVIDFSVNTSPLGPPSEIKEIWLSLYEEIKRYPSVNGDGIKNYYEKHFNLQPGQILPGNGASEAIYLAFQVLAPGKILIITPSFHDYSRAAYLNNVEIFPFPLHPAEEFKMPDLKIIEQKLITADALILGNPNNPTGTLFSREELLYLANTYKTKWFFIDEAFIQFTDDYPRNSLLFTSLPPNILVFHSLTKFYALPGLRLGGVIGYPDTISRLQSFKVPWSVNSLAEKIAPLLLNCDRYEKKVRKIVTGERERIYNFLNGVPGIKVFPSQANFLLAQWTATKNLDDLLKELLNNGIHIRDCRNFAGLENNYFRFAILDAENNDRLLSNIIQSAGKFQ